MKRWPWFIHVACLATASTVVPLGALAGSPGGDAPRQAGAAPRLKPQRTLHAHRDPIHGLAYSHNGKLLGSAGWDGTVRLWDATTGRQVRLLRVETPCLAFSHDGRWLATASYDDTPDKDYRDSRKPTAWLARVWNIGSGRAVHKLAGHTGPVVSVDWSADGKLLATAGGDGSVKVWRTDSWRSVTTLRESFPSIGKGDGVGAMQAVFSADAKTLAVVSVASYSGEPGTYTTRIVLWDTASWTRRRMLMNEPQCFGAVISFTADGGGLVAATRSRASDGDVIFWDLRSGSKRTLVQGGEGSYAAALIPSRRLFAAGGKEWTAFLLDLLTGAETALLPHPTEVMAMAASPDGKTLATGDNDGVIRFWSVPPSSTSRADRSGSAAEVQGK